MKEDSFNTPNPNKPKDRVLKGNKKVLLGISALLLLLIIGTSYAYIMFSAQQESTNVIGTSCVKISLEDLSSAITMEKAYPITDEEGLKTNPYTFRITNECDVPVNYNVNLNVLNDGPITPLDDIALAFDNGEKMILGDLESTVPTYQGKTEEDTATEAKTIVSGILNGKSTITHNLRLWLDYDATNESQNTKFLSKIVIDATQNNDVELREIMASYSNHSGYLTYKTLGSDTAVTCKYGTAENQYTMEGTNVTNTSCELPNLVEDSKYYYEVCLTNSDGVQSCKTGLITTDMPKLQLGKVETRKEGNKSTIVIPYTKSGINLSTNCMYGDQEGNFNKKATTITDNTCEIAGLELGKTYYYQVCVKNEMGTTVCEDGSKYLTNLDAPTGSTENTNNNGDNVNVDDTNGFAYASKIKYQCSGNYCYVKADDIVPITGNVVKSCGAESEPSNCVDVSNVTELQSGIWYQYLGEIIISNTNNKNIVVNSIVCDNMACSEASEDILNKVDVTAPTINANIENITTKSAEILVNANDSESGIKEMIIKYWDSVDNVQELKSDFSGTDSITNDRYILADLNNNTTYNYEITIKDLVGNTNVISSTFKTEELIAPTITNDNRKENLDLLGADVEYAYIIESRVVFESGEKFYIKLNNSVGVNALSNQTCGNGEYPRECNEDNTQTTQNGVWYLVNGSTAIGFNTENNTNTEIYAVSYDGRTFSSITNSSVAKIDRTAPTVSINTLITTSNSITIPFSANDLSGIESATCVYGTSSSYGTNATESSIGQCSLTGLKNNTTYYYKINVTDGVGNTKEITGVANTGDITMPTITLYGYNKAGNNISPINGYLYGESATVNFDAAGITNPSYYIFSDRTATINKTAYECIIDSNSQVNSCNETGTTTISAGKWYKIDGDVVVNYENETNSFDILYAVTYDGLNMSATATATISKIDRTGPNVSLRTAESTTTSLNIPIDSSDSGSGLDDTSAVCGYGTRSGSYPDFADLQTTGRCRINNLENNTTYYYRVTISDKLGNSTTVEGNAKTGNMPKPSITLRDYNTTNSQIAPYYYNEYAYEEIANITFNISDVSHPSYYIKSTKDGTLTSTIDSSLNDCGTGNLNVNNCSSTKTSNVVANHWYRVDGDSSVSLRYNTETDSVATLYAVSYDGNKLSETATATLIKIDRTAPDVEFKGNETITTNNIWIPIKISADNKSGIDYGQILCYYTDSPSMHGGGGYNISATPENANRGYVSSTGCELSNLQNNRTYYYQITVMDKLGNRKSITGSATTGQISKPSISTKGYNYSGTAIGPRNGYVYKEEATVNFDSLEISGASFYIKSTQNARSSVSVYSCGNGSNPGECGSSTTTNLTAGYWYKLNGGYVSNGMYRTTVTYETGSSSTGTLYAATYDGVSFSTTATATIDKIDRSGPSVTLGNPSVTKNSIYVPITTSDDSGINSVTCEYGTSYAYGSTGSASTSGCTISNLNPNTTYYYKIKSTDGVGNVTYKTGSAKTTATIVDTVSVGDYINYQPSNINYNNIFSSKYGASINGASSITPGNIKLWRVISVNSWGVEIVSDTVDANICFTGKEGFLYFDGILNTVATQYTSYNYTTTRPDHNSGYYARAVGFSKLDSMASLEASSFEDLSDDHRYEDDLNKIRNAYGNLKTSDSKDYWLASRHSTTTEYNSTLHDTVRIYNLNKVGSGGSVEDVQYWETGNPYYLCNYVRPIVTLKPDLLVTKTTVSGHDAWKVN